MSSLRRGGRFFNEEAGADKGLADVLRWMLTRKRPAWPAQVENGSYPPPQAPGKDEAAFTFINQATFFIQAGGLTLLTDPVFSERASPLSFAGPKRVRPPGIALEALPRIDVILLSHNHYDHLDLASLHVLQEKWDPIIITGLENGKYLKKKGIKHSIELDWWGSCLAAPGVAVTYVPARHFSSRSLFDHCKMLWGGHVVETPEARLYFAGDTGYGPHFRKIAERLGPPDVALLPIGAYEPRWFMQEMHVNPDEAVLAHVDLKAKLSLAMHYGTFQMSDEAFEAQPADLLAALKARNVADDAFRLPGFGETIVWKRP